MMIIAYDRNQGDDYGPLITRLRELGAKRIQFSLWELDRNTAASTIYSDLRPHLDTGDKLFVAEVTNNRVQYPTGSLNDAIAALLGRP